MTKVYVLITWQLLVMALLARTCRELAEGGPPLPPTNVLAAALPPPTQSIKRKNGATVPVAWNFTNNAASAGLLRFSIKVTPDLNRPTTEIATAPPTARTAQVVVRFTAQDPDRRYFVVSAIYEGVKGESFPSNTILVTRIGPPP